MLRLREECDKGANEWDFDQIDGYDELVYVFATMYEAKLIVL